MCIPPADEEPRGHFAALRRLLHETGLPLQEHRARAAGPLADGRWQGHRTWLVDGSSCSMPDTPALRRRFGQPAGQKPGCGAPLAHLLVLFEHASGRLLDVLVSPWQIHDLRTREDLERIGSPGGALEAFVEARENGLVRFVGVTGHHDPRILLRAVRNWPVDAVLMPVNPPEAVLGGFLDDVLDEARDRGLAIIGMKVLGASHFISPQSGVTPELLVRFALSREISTAIVGCGNPGEVQHLARTGRDFEPLTIDEENRLLELFRPHARRLAFYRGVI